MNISDIVLYIVYQFKKINYLNAVKSPLQIGQVTFFDKLDGGKITCLLQFQHK